jgi:hypothetical protein
MSPAFGRGPLRLPGIGRLKLAVGRARPDPHCREAVRRRARKRARRACRGWSRSGARDGVHGQRVRGTLRWTLFEGTGEPVCPMNPPHPGDPHRGRCQNRHRGQGLRASRDPNRPAAARRRGAAVQRTSKATPGSTAPWGMGGRVRRSAASGPLPRLHPATRTTRWPVTDSADRRHASPAARAEISVVRSAYGPVPWRAGSAAAGAGGSFTLPGRTGLGSRRYWAPADGVVRRGRVRQLRGEHPAVAGHWRAEPGKATDDSDDELASCLSVR